MYSQTKKPTAAKTPIIKQPYRAKSLLPND